MVRQLLTFAKGAQSDRLLVQPRHLFREMERIIRSTFPKNIQLKAACGPKLNTVLGDATQIHQILLNLCVNARDAMPNGGLLTIEAENIEIDSAFVRSHPQAKPGPHVVLRVIDTGSGIPPGVIDRIFDPFFTTKGPENGTGFGLSTVLGIAKSHGGFVTVSSSPGQGSTFVVYLPTADTGAPDHVPVIAHPSFKGNGETVLIVDDEIPVRQVARSVLMGLNFKVLTASDGTEALTQVAENRTDLRVVITDLHMPHMDGLSFVRVLKHMLPAAGIIVASGRLDERDRGEFKTLGISAVLDKPFTQDDLVVALKTALHA